MVGSVTARAPSSTANLGPGFDVFGLALDAFHDEIAMTRRRRGVVIRTEDAIPTDPARNTAGIVARKMRARFGIRDGVDITIKKGVPAGFGMGSSAASAAAAAVAFDRLFDLGLDADSLVRFAGAGELASAGTIHYDNVAASLLGGFVVVRKKPFKVIGIKPPDDLALCVAIPDIEVPPEKTKVSRGRIPAAVKIPEHVENLSSAAGVVAGFAKGDTEMICESIRDVIVEPARMRAIPGFERIKAGALRAGALATTISGAGPSVIAFSRESSDMKRIADAMRRGFGRVSCRTIICKPCGGTSVE